MIVLLIVVIVKKKSAKRDEHGANTINNVNNPEESRGVTKTNEHLEVEPQDKVDYQAIHNEIYYVEYNLIPHFVEMFKDQPAKSSQIILTIYENLVTLQNHLRKVNPFAFGNVSCEICGDTENECLAVFEFPKPFDMPLAKYGAVYFNKLQQKRQYWTLELSLNGNYVLGSMTAERHANYGQRPDLSKEEFIHEVCQSMGVDETVLQQRNVISRKYMLELSDRSFRDAIANSSLVAVCFYDFNPPSQKMLPVLDQLAQEYEGQIIIGLYDVYGGSDNISSAEKYSISALPTILFFVDGEVVNKLIGVCRTENLKAKFEDLLKYNVKARPAKP
jgi:thioredoxin 1